MDRTIDYGSIDEGSNPSRVTNKYLKRSMEFKTCNKCYRIMDIIKSNDGNYYQCKHCNEIIPITNNNEKISDVQ